MILWSAPITLLEQGHVEQPAQNDVQMDFEYLQGKKLHNPSGQPVSGINPPHSKKLFPYVSDVSVSGYYLWSCHWASLKRAWLHPLCTLPSGIYPH